MADSISDMFAGSVTLRMQWARVDAQEVGSVTNKKIATTTYSFTDGTAPGCADLVWAENRTVAANGTDTIDCMAITQYTLGVAVPFAFGALRVVRVANNETVSGLALLVGASADDPFNSYAMKVGPGSEMVAVNKTDSWVVNEVNRLLIISNPSAAPVSYSITFIGVGL